MKKKLTKTIIDSIKPAQTDQWAWDTELEGFGIRVQPSGRKTYVVRYRARDAKRTQRKMNLARCTDMPPDKARELARKVFAQVAEGQDPVADRKPVSAAVNHATVEKMFQAYIDSMRAKKRASVDEVERCLLKSKTCAAAAFGRDRAAADVTPMDVVNYVSGFYKAGHRGAADKHRSYIASAYAWAMKSANDYTAEHRQDWGLTRNPAADVAKDAGAVNTRDRNLTADEIRQLWAATDDLSLEVGACIRLLICCGQRVQETLRIDGADIDLENAVWRMPAHKTKGKKHSHTVPLPKQAVIILMGLMAHHGEGPLFPSRVNHGIICHRSVNQAISRWLETVDIPHFQTRDLRRTWKSRAHDAGVDRFTRDLIQQHAKGGDTGSKHYDRADYEKQMREGMEKWSAWLESVTA
jgi:integrase